MVKDVGSNKSSKNDRLTSEKAVVLSSVAPEYQWLQRHYPSLRPIQQSLRKINGKPYDVMVLQTAACEKKEVYFDISGFFAEK